MDYVSICSGIEAATVAWHPLGWTPVLFAEIEKFPCAVLRHRYPEVPNAGDFTAIDGGVAADLLVGGTPCQDFSVAGLRKGLDGERGQLTIEFARLAHRLASRARTRWLVWENVPGILSSDGGWAFALFLSTLAGRSVRVPAGGWAGFGIIPGGADAWGLAYRVLDAQYFGVPQRRRRVFVVGYFGDWRRAAAVLLERSSLSRNFAPRRETRQRIAWDVAPGIGASGRGFSRAGETRGQDCVIPCDDEAGDDGGLISGAVSAKWSKQSGGPAGDECYNLVGVTIHGTDKTARTASFTDIAGALRARVPGSVENSSTTAVMIAHIAQETADPISANEARTYTHEGRNNFRTHNLVASLDTELNGSEDVIGPLKALSRSGGGVKPAVAIHENQRAELSLNDTVGSLKVGGGKPGQGYPAVAFTCSEQANGFAWELDAQVPNDSRNIQQGIRSGMAVRRLTPLECERLQGFPDHYTRIGARTPDGPRYKALGNSMAVPVMRWLGQRIAMVEAL